MKFGKDRLFDATASNVAPRAPIAIRLGIKTFGTRHYLDVTTLNISASGMLVHVDDPKVMAPFQNKTLLEMIIYPDGKNFFEELHLTGVVVRSIMDQANQSDQAVKREFGVRVIELPEALEQVIGQALKVG